MRGAVLILEPAESSRGALEQEFRSAAPSQWQVRAYGSSEALLAALPAELEVPDQLVIVPEDTGAAPESGLALVPQIRQIAPRAVIVVLADRGTVELAAQAIDAGATDFLVRGDRLGERIATLFGKLRGLFEVIDRNRLLQQRNAQLQQSLQARLSIVGESPQIRALRELILRVADVPRPVLIVGERGTGKELVARAIHTSHGESTRPMVTMNCAAFHDSLLESELFGYEKGAFTGAETTRHGKFEQAHGGTLFLDEIGNMSLPFQEKILRIVEYGTFARVGGSEERKTEVRIIAATNRDLRDMIRRGEFLADLYDRLSFETVEVPALRKREGDIPVLAQYFLDQFAAEIPAFRNKRLSPQALTVLGDYQFPGNVRELKNIIERAAYRDTTDQITPQDLGLANQTATVTRLASGTFAEQLEQFSRQLLVEALDHSGGNQAEAARLLGLTYNQFRYYYAKYMT